MSLQSLLFSTSTSWKTELIKFFDSSIIDYESAANYLSQVLPTIPDSDKPAATFILAYTLSNLNNPDAELQFIKEFFENCGMLVPEVDFLPSTLNLKITDYYASWLNKYPLVTDFSLSTEKIPFLKKPSSLSFKMLSQNISSYKISVSSKIVSSGLLKKGVSSVDIPFPNQFTETELPLELELSFANISVTKKYSLILNTPLPAGVFIDKDQILKFIDKKFKNETSHEIIVDQKVTFDKKYFFKNSLPLLLGGIGAFALNSLSVKRSLDDPPHSPSSDAFLSAANRALTGISISLSALSVINFIKSFRHKSLKEDISSTDEAAVQYNNFLRDQLKQIAESIVIQLKLIAGGAK